MTEPDVLAGVLARAHVDDAVYALRPLFILDALAPLTDAQLRTAADDLSAHLTTLGTDVRVARRLVSGPSTHGQGD